MKNNDNTASKQLIRVSAFVDGFNLYHAIDDLGRNDLKWLNLRDLLSCFTKPDIHDLREIFYFSAYADWMPDKRKRHMAYVRALRHARITPVMGNFKENQQRCLGCGRTWTAHEEKQSDVNLAVELVREAYKNSYDLALIVTSDSDLAPPIKLLCEIFPEKKVKVISPPGRMHSKELGRLASKRAKIQIEHLEKSLFPADLATATGLVVRPAEYA
jgi:uncharacterized LabA/DUF88 family protein